MEMIHEGTIKKEPHSFSVFKHRQHVASRVFKPCILRTLIAGINTILVCLDVAFIVDLEMNTGCLQEN